MCWWGDKGVIMAKQPQLEDFGTNLVRFRPLAQLKKHEMVLARCWWVVRSCPQGHGRNYKAFCHVVSRGCQVVSPDDAFSPVCRESSSETSFLLVLAM